MAFGIRQPTLYGNICCNPCPPEVIAFVTNVIDNGLKLRHPQSPLSNQQPASQHNQQHNFIAFILRRIITIQQQHQVPVFDEYIIGEHISEQSLNPQVSVALPYKCPQTTLSLLNWFSFVVNYLAEHYQIFSKMLLPDILPYLKSAEDSLETIRSQLNTLQLAGMNTFKFLKAANQLKVPVTPYTANIFQLGIGKNSCLLDSSYTDKTSVIGASIAKSKMQTALLLAKAGLPTSNSTPVASELDVENYCKAHSFPVVVKPDNLDQGQGVFAYLTTEQDAIKAYVKASKLSKNIIMQQHVFGNDYRLTVFQNKVIKVVKRNAAGIIGDGHSSIACLVAKAQQTTFAQGVFRTTGKALISLDEEALDLIAAQGYKADSILPDSEFIMLRRKSNMSTGGTVELVDLNKVHPDNIQLAINAATLANLDLAGIDLIIGNIEQSWLDIPSTICELNAQPQIGDTVTPTIYKDILKAMLNDMPNSPIHLLICGEVESEIANALDNELPPSSASHAVVSKAGIQIDGTMVTSTFTNNFDALIAAVCMKNIASAVCVMTIDEVITLGLPIPHFERITVLVPDSSKTAEYNNKLSKLCRAHCDTFLVKVVA
ncbi:hypothetical protein DXX93_13725 [Thalassotalea euphylliae]|uniref:ATP-grasp domain-containing protein n=2 Tax=Thalassotalea euphylliae TaxID=1655234 RepID=A0A3E0TU68_9GAMM|nr:hypothetical protein DXX93_13725 [Thalassotalea euphylliae]